LIKRNEIKYPIIRGEGPRIRIILNRLDFSEVYPPRIVTSLYFDYPSLRFFRESEEGLTPRIKIRTRWYGKGRLGWEHSLFEIKYTLQDHRRKMSTPIDSIKGNASSHFRKVQNGEILPQIYVRYLRRYFEDAKGNRVTLDTDIRYSLVGHTTNWKKLVVPMSVAVDPMEVVEFKFFSNTSSLIALDNFSLQQGRFSKYCSGLSLLMAWSH